MFQAQGALGRKTQYSGLPEKASIVSSSNKATSRISSMCEGKVNAQ